jgi:hypothetical protein
MVRKYNFKEILFVKSAKSCNISVNITNKNMQYFYRGKKYKTILKNIKEGIHFKKYTMFIDRTSQYLSNGSVDPVDLCSTEFFMDLVRKF